MKKYGLTLIVLMYTLQLQAARVVFWNVRDFGKSKSAEEIAFIAERVRGADIVALQEVVAGFGGVQTVARLQDALNRTGAHWEMRVSEPTAGVSQKSERYAFLWRPASVQLRIEPSLYAPLRHSVEREPYAAVFVEKGKVFRVVVFHAITARMHPQTEVRALSGLLKSDTEYVTLLGGDFNCAAADPAFDAFRKLGFKPVLWRQKTSLRRTCPSGDCLSSAFDNIWFQPSLLRLKHAGVDLFFQEFDSYSDALGISDHVPVFIDFECK